jgi:hypothetical protein
MYISGNTVYLYHYSRNMPYKCELVVDNIGTLDFSISSKDLKTFIKFEPVVICYHINSDEVRILSCDIAEIDIGKNLLQVKLDEEDLVEYEEKRKFERYPVSMFTDIRASTLPKKCFALIKNLSYSGMLIYSKSQIPDDEEFDIDLYADKQVIFLKAKVMRIVNHGSYFEYGLQIVYSNYTSMEAMKSYVEGLKNFHKNMIKKLENTY